MQAIAARIGSTQPALVMAPRPREPRAGEVLCRTLVLGVCGTDREILHAAQPLVPDGEEQLILGHECLARVEQVGDGVEDFRVGDLVVPVVRRALLNDVARPDMLAFGLYTERGIVREHGVSQPLWLDRPEHLFRVSSSVASVAVLTEPVSVAEKGINEALAIQRGRLGDTAWTASPPRVLVTGLGPIAFAAVLASRCRGWPVAVYGRDPDDSFRACLAAAFGAKYLKAQHNDLAPDDVQRDGFDLILECTGSDEVMIRAARSLATRGVMVWLGSSRVPQPASHNLARMMRDGIIRNHVHVGSVNAAPRDFADALLHLEQMLHSHPHDVRSLITDRVVPADSLWHYQHRTPQGIKTVLVYE